MLERELRRQEANGGVAMAGSGGSVSLFATKGGHIRDSISNSV